MLWIILWWCATVFQHYKNSQTFPWELSVIIAFKKWPISSFRLDWHIELFHKFKFVTSRARFRIKGEEKWDAFPWWQFPIIWCDHFSTRKRAKKGTQFFHDSTKKCFHPLNWIPMHNFALSTWHLTNKGSSITLAEENDTSTELDLIL